MTPESHLEAQENLFPEGYRMTELGPLPEEWRVAGFNECVIRVARVPKVKKSEYRNIGLVPIVDQGQSFIAGYTDGIAPYERELPVIVFGDHTRVFKFVDFPFVAGADGTQVLAPNRRLFEPLFLYFAFLNLDIPSRGYNRHLSLLREKKVPLPPLPEQRAIAHVLRTVQQAKEATERVIAAARELKKSLMRHLFTYGPVPVDQTDQVPMQDTEIGPIPAHWRVVKLGEVATLRKNTILPAEAPNAKYVGLEHLDSGEIFVRRQGIAVETKSAKAVFKPGDILYGKLRPYLDKAAIAEWEGVCSTDILVLVGKPNNVDSYFLAYLMHSTHILSHAIATTTGVNHPRTSWKALSQAIIPLPPLAEQQEIARILQAVDEKIRAEEARKEALETLFKTLLHHLMTAKVRVPRTLVEKFREERGHE